MYNDYFKTFEYELYPFQKESITATFDGYNSLCCAHTGSGKSLCATATFSYFLKKGLKIIYTTPIKSLSNQKYYDFKRTFPEYSIGLMTGDIKIGPDSDIVIMTAEILRNNIDVKNVGLVVMDEVHYINDPERGSVWEETIIQLDKSIQLIMLSATIHKPEIFAEWITKVRERPTKISMTLHRTIPLKHNLIYFMGTGDEKKLLERLRDPLLKKLVSPNKDYIFKESEEFNDRVYYDFKKILNHQEFLNLNVSHKFIINELATFLKKENKLPCIFFSLSRKNVEQYSTYVNQVLLEDSTNIEKECRNIIMQIPNYKEYMALQEYKVIVSNAQKGIAYHHGGLVSVFRELVELLFEKGYIKLLFATETFAVGINLPTKSVCFDSMTKFDGLNRRFLRADEYSQMAGRSGRLGKDSVGYVYHITNFYELPTLFEYKKIMSGTSQKIDSKFSITPVKLLELLKSNPDQPLKEVYLKYISGSMNEYDPEYTKTVKNNINSKKLFFTDGIISDLNKYILLKDYKNNNKNKKILDTLFKKYGDMELLYKDYLSLSVMSQEIKNNMEDIYDSYMTMLTDNGFIENGELTRKGLDACNIREAHPLALAECFRGLSHYNTNEIVSILSIFTERSGEFSEPYYDYEIVGLIKKYYEKYDNIERLNFKLMEYVYEWTLASDEATCLSLINKNADVYLGSFTKAILKINNLALELLQCLDPELDTDVELYSLLKKVPDCTLKFMITNQSLYV